jgi:hypothetical protein
MGAALGEHGRNTAFGNFPIGTYLSELATLIGDLMGTARLGLSGRTDDTEGIFN